MPKAARKDFRRGGQRELLAVAVALSSGAVHALPTLELGESTTLESSLTVNYTASMRTEKADAKYLNDLNSDDGTRNFDRGALITNRVSLFGEMLLVLRALCLLFGRLPCARGVVCALLARALNHLPRLAHAAGRRRSLEPAVLVLRLAWALCLGLAALGARV